MCPLCRDRDKVTMAWSDGSITFDCPLCDGGKNDELKTIMEKCERKHSRVPKIKTTWIPDAGIDDEDDMPCDLAIDDEITDTTIEDVLNNK